MASIIDSIIGAIILIAVLIAVGLIVASAVVKNTNNDLQSERLSHDEKRTDIAVNAILSSTENETGKSVSELIGYSMLTLKTTVTVKKKTVDVVNVTKSRLDLVFGKDNYYLTIKPIVKGVNLIFVLDSSPSTSQERNTIAANLKSIQDKIKESIQTTGEEKTTIQIYLLPADSNHCSDFTSLNLPDLTCEQLTENSLYGNFPNWTQPDFGTGSFANWRVLPHYADVMAFATSDWAAGTATAAYNFEHNSYLKNTVNVNLIFPLSDELPTSSKNDSCFTKQNAPEWYMCQLCDGTCPIKRSRNATQQAIDIVRETSSTVFPIYSVNCDFAYSAGSNQLSVDSGTGGVTTNPYILQFLDIKTRPLYTYPQESWCQQNSCKGCTNQSGGFCFHDNCKLELYDQMAAMANATNGSVFNVNNAAQIPDSVLGAFNRVTSSYEFQIGFPDMTRDRYVYEKVITLPNGKLGKVSLWVYRGKQEKCEHDMDCTTSNDCPGTRTCTNGILNETCRKTDPACLGKPCTSAELCLTPDGCIGNKVCVNGTLSQFCTKTDRNCGSTCVDNCDYIGEQICTSIASGVTTNGTFVCTKSSKDGCLRYKPSKTCRGICNDINTTCIEDICPPQYDCKNADGTCHKECDFDPRCLHDPDCPPPCRMPCGRDGQCNLLCSQAPDSCTADPDCPACVPGPTDSCEQGRNPSCCEAGTTFVWSKRRFYDFNPIVHSSTFCSGSGPDFGVDYGTCCPTANYCLWGGFNCIAEGTKQSSGPSRQFVCAQNVMHECATIGISMPDATTSSGTTYHCNAATGTWETA